MSTETIILLALVAYAVTSSDAAAARPPPPPAKPPEPTWKDYLAACLKTGATAGVAGLAAGPEVGGISAGLGCIAGLGVTYAGS